MGDFISMLTGPLGPIILVGVLAVVLLAIAVPLFLQQRNDPLEKLKKRKAGKASKDDVHQPKQLRDQGAGDHLERYSTFLEPQDVESMTEARKKLMQAGYRTKNAVRIYNFAQFALAILGLIGGVVYYLMFKSGAEEAQGASSMIGWVLGPGVIGYMIPKYWVTKRQQERQEEITNGFPDALDMLLVCVEAGQSLDQSIKRVSEEIRASYPPLADEFEIVSNEIKAGKDKNSVLNDMGERCGVSDISSFVTVLIQSSTFGTSIADALRVYAGEMRDKRVMRAEEKANKLPTKMTLATMMLTVPPLLIILVGPSLKGIMDLGAGNF